MLHSGEIVEVTHKEHYPTGKVGLLFLSQPQYKVYTDYYDGRETGRDLQYVRYIILIVEHKKEFDWIEFDTRDKEYRIRKVASPNFTVELKVEGKDKQVKCSTFEELSTICSAYDLAGLKYEVYSRIC